MDELQITIIEEDKNSGLTEWGTDIEVVKYTVPPIIEEYFGTKNKTNQHKNYGEKNFPGENNNKHQIISISDATYTSLNELASKRCRNNQCWTKIILVLKCQK